MPHGSFNTLNVDSTKGNLKNVNPELPHRHTLCFKRRRTASIGENSTEGAKGVLGGIQFDILKHKNTMNTLQIKKKLEDLRKCWKIYPDQREIIKRQARALQIALEIQEKTL